MLLLLLLLLCYSVPLWWWWCVVWWCRFLATFILHYLLPPIAGCLFRGQVTGQVIQLQEAALFSSAIHMLFLITTMLGLYRWIFQVGQAA